MPTNTRKYARDESLRWPRMDVAGLPLDELVRRRHLAAMSSTNCAPGFMTAVYHGVVVPRPVFEEEETTLSSAFRTGRRVLEMPLARPRVPTSSEEANVCIDRGRAPTSTSESSRETSSPSTWGAPAQGLLRSDFRCPGSAPTGSAEADWRASWARVDERPPC
jgi:hypothetical protein